MPLLPGDPAPFFRARTPTNPTYNFHVAGGRYMALAFMPSRAAAERNRVLDALKARRTLFDDVRCCFFGVLRHPAAIAKAQDQIPGIRWFLDADAEVSSLYEMQDGAEERSGWVVLDPAFRVLMTAPIAATDAVLDQIAALPPVDEHAGAPMHAPVLVVPRVFEPGFCKHLIDLYEAKGGEPSGFMREIDGRTVMVRDPEHKRRSDVVLEDTALIEAARARIARRLAPEVAKAFQFTATRIERYLVARYVAEEGGFFRPHRDNTTKGTAHRRFAVTLNLNAGEYEGGDLRFPEYGGRTYRAPTGGAVVFSCSLLHEATPVTKSRRYAFLPFLYDEAAAKIREENLSFLAG